MRLTGSGGKQFYIIAINGVFDSTLEGNTETTAMNLIFRLRFHTKVGQSLWLTGNHPFLGDGATDKAVPLQYFNDEFWQATISVPPEAANKRFSCNYILRNADGCPEARTGAVTGHSSLPNLAATDCWSLIRGTTPARLKMFFTPSRSKMFYWPAISPGRARPFPAIRRIRSGSRRLARQGPDALSARRRRGAGKLEHREAGFIECVWRTKMI